MKPENGRALIMRMLMRVMTDAPLGIPAIAPDGRLAFNPFKAIVGGQMEEANALGRSRGVPHQHFNALQHAWTSARLQIAYPEFAAVWFGNTKENKCTTDAGANIVRDSVKDQINNFQGREIAQYVGSRSMLPPLIFKRKEMIEDLVMEAYMSGALAKDEVDPRIDGIIGSGGKCNDVSTFDARYLAWPGPSAAFKAKYGL